MAEKCVRAKLTVYCSNPRLSRRLQEVLEDEGHEVEIKAPTKRLRPARARIHVETVHDLRGNAIEADFNAEGEYSKE